MIKKRLANLCFVQVLLLCVCVVVGIFVKYSANLKSSTMAAVATPPSGMHSGRKSESGVRIVLNTPWTLCITDSGGFYYFGDGGLRVTFGPGIFKADELMASLEKLPASRNPSDGTADCSIWYFDAASNSGKEQRVTKVDPILLLFERAHAAATTPAIDECLKTYPFRKP